MMQIKFKTDNVVFHEDLEGEVDRILNEIRHKVRFDSRGYGVIHDVNGNGIGEWELDVED